MLAAWFRLGALALIAPAGVLIGHTLTYLTVVPDPAQREQVLAASGHAHGWWARGTVAGAILAAAGLILLICCLLRRAVNPNGDDRRWG